MKKEDFQKKVVKHLKKKGFNCIVHSDFPDIIAWKPFEDSNKGAIALNVEADIEGKVFKRVLFPFFVVLVECKKDKKLNKKETNVAKKILEEGRCNSFMVAYQEKRKLKFHEIEMKDNPHPIIKPMEKPLPSYLG